MKLSLRAPLLLALASSSALGLYACDDEEVRRELVGTERWVVGSWAYTAEEYAGYLSVVDSLTTQSAVDLGAAIEIGGDFGYVAGIHNDVFVGLDSSPIIERWVLGEDDVLTKSGEVSFANFGVSNTYGKSSNVIHIIDDTHAYFVDIVDLRVIGFDPSTMTTGTETSIAGLDEVAGSYVDVRSIVRDGNRLIIAGRYYGDDAFEYTTSIVRAAIFDLEDHSVDYIEDTRCGGVLPTVVDDDGNIYFASHPGLSMNVAAGGEGSNPTEPCIVRIEAGADDFDPSYFVDLSQLSGGISGGVYGGTDGIGYTVVYQGAAIEPGLAWPAQRALLQGANWALHRFDLANPEGTFEAVANAPLSNAYAASFVSDIVNPEGIRETRTFLSLSGAGFGSGQLIDVTDPSNPVVTRTFNGTAPGIAIRLR